MNQKYFISTAIILAVIISVGFAADYFLDKPKSVPAPVACTMEAKLCPDGSAVGRSGPNCEFAACPAIPPAPAEKSGITGVAMLGPMCPVERIPPDPQCADRPYKTSLVATYADETQIVAQFDSDANGKFSVDLAPGEYNVSSADTASFFSHCQSNGTIQVLQNKYTEITLNCDTGIR